MEQGGDGDEVLREDRASALRRQLRRPSVPPPVIPYPAARAVSFFYKLDQVP